MVEETTLRVGYRLTLDFTVNVFLVLNIENFDFRNYCPEFGEFPFPKELSNNYSLPSPLEVTGPVSFTKRKKHNIYPYFKSIYLNGATIKNSDLVLGTDLVSKCNTVSPGAKSNKLPFSNYPSRRFNPNNIQSLQNFNNDICTDYTWKPQNNWKGDVYKNKGNSETYKQSKAKPLWYPGWIQPSKCRNKWPRLLSEPRDRFEWPSKPVGFTWDCLGLMKPDSTLPNNKYPGTRYSTQQTPRVPLYWPTVTGLPINGGENYWMFNTLKGSDTTNVLSR